MVTPVSIKDIKPNPFQVRREMDPEGIQQLADEISQTGYWSGGIRARKAKAGGYELVFGHRRLEALKLLGYKRIDVDVVEVDDTQMLVQGLAENLQRKNLTDLEKAEGVSRLVDTLGSERSDPVKYAAQLLSYSVQTIQELRKVSRLTQRTKDVLAKQNPAISRRAIAAGLKLGGEDAVVATANLPVHTLLDIEHVASEMPEAAKKKAVSEMVEGLKSGKIKTDTLEDRAKLASSLKIKGRKHAGKQKKAKAPPDLHDVLYKWSGFIGRWRKELKAVEPYREYIDSDPDAAAIFRKAVAGLIDDLKALL